jgi:hypothetical protein
MAAATTSRNTPRRSVRLITLPVKANTVIHKGTKVARDADGWAVPAADAAGLVVIGLAVTDVDNTDGANGALTVECERICALLGNSAANAVTKAHVGKPCYVEDDQTVASAPGTNGIKAGEVIEVDDDGVWVEVGKFPGAVARTTLGNANGEISGLTISAAYSQVEMQALRTALEELADDFRAFVALNS